MSNPLEQQIYFVIIRTNSAAWSPRVSGTFPTEQEAVLHADSLKDQVLEGSEIIVARAIEMTLKSSPHFPKETLILS